MGKVFVVPGSLGSELWSNIAAGNNRVWPDVDYLARNGLDPMRLDGTVGGSAATGAVQLIPSKPLESHYKRGLQILSADLDNGPWETPIPWGYDWRLGCTANGTKLGQDIDSRFAEDGPAIIIAHSEGGLVARLAYYYLKKLGKDDRISRIICMGTPHKGTVATIRAMDGFGKEGQLFALRTLLVNPSPIGLLKSWTISEATRVAEIMLTWPAWFDLMPRKTDPGSYRDKAIDFLFTNAYWSRTNDNVRSRTSFKAIMDNTTGVTHVRLADPDSVPPGRKLVNIISRGYPTYELYGYPDDFALFPARFLTTDEGDGTVTADSAFVPGSERAFIESPHDRLFLTCVESGLLKFYINQAWAPTQSPPVVEKVVANAPPNDLIAPIPLVRPPQPTGPKRGIPRHR